MKESIELFLKGLAMGAANVIPGVSGGTIALITGIYEKLINSIKSFDLNTIRLLFSGKFREFWERINGSFLLAIFLGIGASIFSIAFLFKALLKNETYTIWLYAFFFGLILVSVYSVGRTVNKWSGLSIVTFLVGLAAAVSLALVNPAQENQESWYLVICGVVAMCSMILPGLSGSFVLILMGNYKLVMVDAVSELNLKVIIPVAIGAIAGIIAFSRVLSWIFKHYRDITISLLTGFILGSLAIIWPWKAELPLMRDGEIVKKSSGEIVTGGYEWFMPDFSDMNTWIAVLIAIAGGISLWMIERFANNTPTDSNE